MAGEVSAAFHSLTVPSAEHDSSRWWAELYTNPHTASVWPHMAPRSTDGSKQDRKSAVINITHSHYLRSHVKRNVPYESYGSMFGLGVFQLWMVPSNPPLKHWSPLELITTHRTGPLWQRTTESHLIHLIRSDSDSGQDSHKPVSPECVDGFHVESCTSEHTNTREHQEPFKCINTSKDSAVFSLLGWSGFLQVPHLQRVIFRSGDQNRLHRVERQTADGVEMIPQCELWVPCLAQSIFVVGDLRKRKY